MLRCTRLQMATETRYRWGPRLPGGSSSRTAVVEARRSATPRGRGRGKGRGGRRATASQRAASVSRADDSGGNENADRAELREAIAVMQQELDARAGPNSQLQAKVDELRASQQAPFDSGDAVSAGEPEVIVANMKPPPPGNVSRSPHMRRFAKKANMNDWRPAVTRKRWHITAVRQAGAVVSVYGVQATRRLPDDDGVGGNRRPQIYVSGEWLELSTFVKRRVSKQKYRWYAC